MITATPSEHNLESLPLWTQELIKQLTDQVQQLSTQVQQLTARVHELESQLSKNSTNSGKPPSSDGLKKPPKTQSLRGKSGRKPGGQVGRKGNTLRPVEVADDVQIHSPITCMGCQASLEEVQAVNVDKRQVFDLPPIAMRVMEHQAQTKICPCCGTRNKGTFPEGVNAPVQYGERIKALAAYFLHQHLIPFERVAQIFEDIFDMAISPGTCVNMDKKLFKNLGIFEASLKAHLLICKVLHLDETGVRCEKKLHWIHVTSSDTATFYGLHAKRGCEAVEAIGILPEYTGSIIHDHWHCYFSYQQVKHGLCNVHHLRELRYVYEEEQSVWAKSMADFLLKSKKLADQARAEGKASLTSDEIASIEGEFRSILLGVASTYLAAAEEGHPQETVGKQGFNLFRRFLKRMDEVLYFVKDLSIPFSNNLAEQDLRMEKVKQKISGCFRTFSGGVISCRVRSYISTARKQGWSIIDSLTEAIRGSPRMLLHS
jgi:transposase